MRMTALALQLLFLAALLALIRRPSHLATHVIFASWLDVLQVLLA